jgi:hypothetical protein
VHREVCRPPFDPRRLEHVKKCCRELLDRQVDLMASHIARALLDSAVIRYQRCFNCGLRKRLQADRVGLSDHELELHEFLIALPGNSAIDIAAIRRSFIGSEGRGPEARGADGPRPASLQLSPEPEHQRARNAAGRAALISD